MRNATLSFTLPPPPACLVCPSHLAIQPSPSGLMLLSVRSSRPPLDPLSPGDPAQSLRPDVVVGEVL
eukprot:2215877-Pyramimonas_sp.AAC.1